MSVLWTSEDGKYFISSDKSPLKVHDSSEVAGGVPWIGDIDKVRTQVIQMSREVFGVYYTGEETTSTKLVGITRLSSDMVRFTWIGDFYIAPPHRAKGLGKALFFVLQSQPSYLVPHVMLDCRKAEWASFFSQLGNFVPVTRDDQLSENSTMYKWIPPANSDAESKEQLNINIHPPEELKRLPHPSIPGYFASTDASLLDPNVAHNFLTNSYWAAGISLDKVTLAMSNSDCIGIYHLQDEQNGKPKQIGYARWITDRITFAYLADVFIHKDHAGQGLGRWLSQVVLSMEGALPYKRTKQDSELNEATAQSWNPRKMLLLRTSTAQSLYERYGGFRVLLPDDEDGPIVLRVPK